MSQSTASLRAELAKVVAERAKARRKACKSIWIGSLIFDPFTKAVKLGRRESELRAMLSE